MKKPRTVSTLLPVHRYHGKPLYGHVFETTSGRRIEIVSPNRDDNIAVSHAKYLYTAYASPKNATKWLAAHHR
jgi:hypothetical protein